MPDATTPESDSSETNLVIVTRRDRFKIFCKLYWRVLVILLTPLVILPIAFIGSNNAYKCFYAFLITATYWVTDAMHPGITALIPIALSSILCGSGFISEMYIRNELLDCIGIMLIIVAIEQSQIQKRVAHKLLLIFGCSHYRLSFLLFFMTMFLSMWISGIIACGLMMPLVKAILIELEKLFPFFWLYNGNTFPDADVIKMMGILELYQTIGKSKQRSVRHGESNPRPSDFTVFYFLGISYSSSIGSMATITGSQTNQILKIYCEELFPLSPKIAFPHFMLLNLPGVIVMQTILYFWMNFYFMGMCRAQSDVSVDTGITEEEALYINTLLAAQYQQMGKITFHEWVVGTVVLVTAVLQSTLSYAYIDNNFGPFHNHFRVSSPCIFCAVSFFIIPRNTNFLKFFKKRSECNQEPLPQSPSRTCLTWPLVKQNINWSVLFIVGGSAALFESLRDSQMTVEFEKFLLLCASWPPAAKMLVIIIFFKILTEFAPSSCVAYSLLPNVARLGLLTGMNSHYMMMAATLSCSLSFHLVTGSPANAMVADYVHISSRKMMTAGVGVSVASIVVAWFTVAAWASAVWDENYMEPAWAKANMFTQGTLGLKI